MPIAHYLAWFKTGSGTFVRSTLRAVPAKVPDPLLNHAKQCAIGILVNYLQFAAICHFRPAFCQSVCPSYVVSYGTLSLGTPVMTYIIAYDIADPKRLNRVARFLERWALRCQKSVFLFKGTEVALGELLEDLTPILKLDEDCVQAWRVATDQSDTGKILGTAATLYPASAVLHVGKPLLVECREP